MEITLPFIGERNGRLLGVLYVHKTKQWYLATFQPTLKLIPIQQGKTAIDELKQKKYKKTKQSEEAADYLHRRYGVVLGTPAVMLANYETMMEYIESRHLFLTWIELNRLLKSKKAIPLVTGLDQGEDAIQIETLQKQGKKTWALGSGRYPTNPFYSYKGLAVLGTGADRVMTVKTYESLPFRVTIQR